MRIAVISDIHGNLEALESVLACIDKQAVDRIYITGDLVDFGPNPKQVIALTQRSKLLVVKGNHDDAANDYFPGKFGFRSLAEQQYAEAAIKKTREVLNAADLEYLRALPVRLEQELAGAKVLFTHSVPTMYNYPFEVQVKEFLQENSWQYVFHGHTHRPGVITHKGKTAINVGSTGKPKHGNARACYCTADFFGGQLIELSFRFVTYPVDTVISRIKERRFPLETIDMLKEGKDFTS